MKDDRREYVALVSSSSGGVMRSFTIEAEGFLVLNNSNDYHIIELNPNYKQFYFKKHD